MKDTAILALDVGGQSIKWGIVNQEGNLLERGQVQIAADETLQSFENKIALLYTAQKGTRVIDGIGICVPGIISPKQGRIIGCVENIPILYDVPLKEHLQYQLSVPVQVCNDAKAAAMGEMWLGSAKHLEDFLFVTLGTGIGGCLVLNGKIRYGQSFCAGELGYLDYHQPDDYFERNYSAKAVFDRVAASEGKNIITGMEFFEEVSKKNILYLDILNDWLTHLCRTFANIAILLDLQKIIVGGGISAQRDILNPMLRETFQPMLPDNMKNLVGIETASCANDAGFLGAASLFYKDNLRRSG